MTIWQFASDCPWTVFFLALIALSALRSVLRYCINRPLRAMNIRKHGWPPAHCDADGDFRDDNDS